MYTVITKGNEVRQVNCVTYGHMDDIIVVNESGRVLLKKGNPINWPADASDGLQAIVDVKAGTLRFCHNELIGLTEFVVSNYVEDSAPVHVLDLIKEWPIDGTRPTVLVSPPGFSWRHHGDGHPALGVGLVLGDWRDTLERRPDMNKSEPKIDTSEERVQKTAESIQVTAASMLTAALGHMEDRAKTYDAPGGERSMGKTVAAFNTITGHTLTEEAGWLFMEILKQVRSQQGDYRADNYEDMVAYAALRGECAARERGNK